MGFLRKFPLINRSMAAVAYNEMKTPPSMQTKNKDESIHSFISRRFGTEVCCAYVFCDSKYVTA